MKITKAVLSLSMLAAGIASAASGYSVTLSDAVWIGGTQLKAGDYKVEMQGDKAVFTAGSKKVAEAPATLGTGDQKYAYTTLSTSSSKLREIDLGGTKSKIVFAADAEPAVGSK